MLKRLEFLAALLSPALLPVKELLAIQGPSAPSPEVPLPRVVNWRPEVHVPLFPDYWTVVEVGDDYVTIEASKAALAALSGPCLRFHSAGTMSLRDARVRDALQVTFYRDESAALVRARSAFEQPLNFTAGDSLEVSF